MTLFLHFPNFLIHSFSTINYGPVLNTLRLSVINWSEKMNLLRSFCFFSFLIIEKTHEIFLMNLPQVFNTCLNMTKRKNITEKLTGKN